jgi:hypothetical protein
VIFTVGVQFIWCTYDSKILPAYPKIRTPHVTVTHVAGVAENIESHVAGVGYAGGIAREPLVILILLLIRTHIQI